MVESPVKIRPYADADHQAVVALWTSVFANAAAHNRPEEVIRRKLDFQRELFFIADTSGQVVGTVMAGYDGHRGWIYALAVSPEVRQRGIGAALLQHAEQALQELGCLKVNLQVLSTHEFTVAFYEKLGYKVEPRVSLGKLLQ